MKTEFVGTCPKEMDEPSANEDWFSISQDGLRLALCDGASESYNSRLWANIVACKFARDPKFGSEWLSEAVQEFIASHDFQNMSWSQQSAFEKGSFCTLLGVEHDQIHDTVEILAVGDCLALLVDGNKLVQAWPYDDPERFKEHPTLLSTLTEHNIFISELGFWNKNVQTIQLNSHQNPKLFCMTDALGEWALRNALSGTDGLSRLSALTTQEELCALVVEERAHKRMRVDDSTLIIFSFGDIPSTDGLSIP